MASPHNGTGTRDAFQKRIKRAHQKQHVLFIDAASTSSLLLLLTALAK